MRPESIHVFALLTGICFSQIAAAHDGEHSPFNASFLPVVSIQTGDHLVMNRIRVRSAIMVGGNSTGSIQSDFVGQAEISVRGNSSYHFNKKSYRLELQNENGTDRKASLLGMPADSDWVLYASVTDKTFVRNVLAHELWRQMGRYAVRWRFVDLFMMTNAPSGVMATTTGTGEGPPPSPLKPFASSEKTSSALFESNNYLGVYVLMEKVKRGQNRLNIRKLNPDDIKEPDVSGGYMFKKDAATPGERGFLTGQEFSLLYVEPKESEVTPAQKRWLEKYLNDFEKALFSLDFRDPVKGYGRYVDVESFIDFHWLVEVARNADGYWFSEYMHKDRSGKIVMGPLWDWDNTFGNPYFAGSHTTNGWRFTHAADPDYTWFGRLFEDPDFLQRYIDRWSELRTNILATSNVVALIEKIATQLNGAEVRNYQRWPILGTKGSIRVDIVEFYQDDLRALKRWVEGRLAWIDSQDFPKPVLIQSGTNASVAMNVRSEKESTCEISMSSQMGRIFYTTDGTDPRMRGGGVSSRAFEYKAPFLLGTQTPLVARVRSDFSLWSAPVRINGTQTRPQ